MNTTRALTLFLALALLGLVFLALATPTARAAPPVILRVTVTGATSDLSCGTSWANPCGLQHALTTVAITGTELWVAAGTYKPTAGADRFAAFQLRDGIALYGGFAGGETARNQRNITEHATILSGDINVLDNTSDNSFHVVTGSGVTNTAVLDGFTVTGGNANGFDPNDRGGGIYNVAGNPMLSNVTFIGNTADHGGGMYNDTSSNPMLTNITFRGNVAHYQGGGMYNGNNSNPTLTNVTFSSNEGSYRAGGMHNDYSNPTLTNTIFISNSTGSYGAGMYNYYSSPTLTNTAFLSNTASNEGGGIFNWVSSPTFTNVTFGGNSGSNGGGMYSDGNSDSKLTNVTFSGNTASANGGAIYNYWVSDPTLTNVTFSGNSAGSEGGGMYNYYSSPTITNTIFWGNTAPSGAQVFNDIGTPSLSDSVVQGGCPVNSNCTDIITTDPVLGALGAWGGSTQTIPLLPGSSAIDAGNDATCAPTDQRGKSRVGTCDVGAFEFQGFALTKTSGDNQRTPINTPFADPLEITLTEMGSPLPLPGMTITFTAPSSGPSAAWSGSLTEAETTNLSGVALVGPPTANGILGTYAVIANASGATAPVTFALTNTNWLFHLPLIKR